MPRMPLTYWLLLLAALGGGVHWWQNRPVYAGPGILAPESPQQETLRDAPAIALGDFLLQPVARFRVEARVLGRENYRFDREASLSPVDLALGWGPMSDGGVLDKLRITQGNRFYYYAWQGTPPIPPRHIALHSANMHLIPANAEVAAALERVRVGQLVRFEGLLVNARHPDGGRWNSSTRRDDTGAGACELVWVQRLETSDPL